MADAGTVGALRAGVIQESNEKLAKIAERLGVELTESYYGHHSVPFALRTPDGAPFTYWLAEREQQLVAVIEVLTAEIDRLHNFIDGVCHDLKLYDHEGCKKGVPCKTNTYLAQVDRERGEK